MRLGSNFTFFFVNSHLSQQHLWNSSSFSYKFETSLLLSSHTGRGLFGLYPVTLACVNTKTILVNMPIWYILIADRAIPCHTVLWIMRETSRISDVFVKKSYLGWFFKKLTEFQQAERKRRTWNERLDISMHVLWITDNLSPDCSGPWVQYQEFSLQWQMVVGINGIQVSQRKMNLAAGWIIIQGLINGVWTEQWEGMRDFLKQSSIRIDGWLKKVVEKKNIKSQSWLRFWVWVTLGEWQDLRLWEGAGLQGWWWLGFRPV